MNIIRKVKISKIVDVNFSEKEKEILDIIEKLIYLHKHVYGNTCVYVNSCSYFIFEANHDSNRIYVNKDLWNSVESNMSNNKYINTQKIFDYFIKKRYEDYISFYVMPKY